MTLFLVKVCAVRNVSVGQQRGEDAGRIVRQRSILTFTPYQLTCALRICVHFYSSTPKLAAPPHLNNQCRGLNIRHRPFSFNCFTFACLASRHLVRACFLSILPLIFVSVVTFRDFCSDFPLIIPFIMRQMKMSGPDDCLEIIQVVMSIVTAPLLSQFPRLTLHSFQLVRDLCSFRYSPLAALC
jgi:hypothetical protein